MLFVPLYKKIPETSDKGYGPIRLFLQERRVKNEKTNGMLFNHLGHRTILLKGTGKFKI
jgi:hypothetical protein